LLQLTILAALKLTRANAQNIIFVAELWEKKLNILNAEIWERRPKIRGSHHQNLKPSCNKKKKIHGLRLKLPQLFYFRWSHTSRISACLCCHLQFSAIITGFYSVKKTQSHLHVAIFSRNKTENHFSPYPRLRKKLAINCGRTLNNAVF
jgi:hypothetical protein